MKRIKTRAAGWLPFLLGSALMVTGVAGAQTVGLPAPVTGDCTSTQTGSVVCGKTNGTAFAPSATTDTTNAANITSGLVASERLPTFGGTVVYNKGYFTGLTDFNVGGTSPTVANGVLTLPAPSSPGGYGSEYLELANVTTADELVDFSVTLTVNALGSTGYGVALGRQSANTTYIPCMSAHWQLGSTNTINSIAFRGATSTTCAGYNSNYPTLSGTTTPGTVTVAVGDEIQLIWSQRFHHVTFIAYDITQNAVLSSTVYSTLTPTQNFPVSNTSRFRILNFGGAYTVENISVISRQAPNMRVAIIGTSKTDGRDAGTIGNVWWHNLPGVGPVAPFGGDGDKSTEMLLQLPYLLQYFHPSYIVVECCRNDAGNGMSTAQSKANMVTMTQQIEAAGAVPILLLPIPDASDQSAIATAIQQIAAADSKVKVIDPTPNWNASVDLASDNLHPNPAGSRLIGANVLSGWVSAGLPLGTAAAYTPPPSLATYYANTGYSGSCASGTTLSVNGGYVTGCK